ncbi:MFS transporter [Sphingomonas sp. BIUV-7]|uniref:MFS transporter n=1 Tax=Sphingomonas natans TaxID=3063330 RepID=A0ABT8YAF4_9SPHN|nr:MFS transporter [Sphingomonas sp. BIUV-7]MDO6415322.1 MFS transporter [Sphingomonas sp. BIUV-7]
MGLGIAGLLTYTAGIFAKDLQTAIGLTRTQLGTAFFLSTIALACALPIVGRLVDRYGPRWPAMFGAVALSAGFLALGTFVQSVPAYMIVMALVGFGGAFSAPVAYMRAVSGAFDRSRGLALGLTQSGIGVAAMVVPPIVAATVATNGWQAGYKLLALIALAGTIPASRLPRSLILASQTPEPRAAFSSSTFLLLLTAFGAMALAFAGFLPHFVPMLRESGMEARSAGQVAGLIGASVIVSRLIVGWLSDRYEAPRVAAGCCAICAAGCLTLALGGTPLAWVGAIALGSAMGAEADLIGYLTARYFGMARYGRLYALQYASFMLMAGVGPVWVGALADRTSSYRAPLFVAAAGLVVAILLFLRLPRVRPRQPSSIAMKRSL